MPSANKGKGKGQTVRRSRSRNTTPSSISAGPTSVPPSSVYLENDPSKLIVPTNVQYAEMLARMGAGPIPDSKSLETLMDHLKSLSQMVEAREDACNAGMRELSQRRKEVSDDREDVGERTKMKRETDEDEDGRAVKGAKLKKRKDRASKDERPLDHGAHEVARQDGGETKIEGGK